ncbi:AraC family transcriptional regulator [Nocardiopsis synnemataformans]|uniref:AraC family transcriptional regulator n=1 Tax=Nocardiopsis synnemataformans TaxID=61305 RepID=UPI003EBDC706
MLDRLNKALEHVEEDPGRPVDVAAMARTALTSEHHLRRKFAALAGMPLSEYVRRRRLTLAGAEVMECRRTLLDIAVGHGYSSAEAFTRAFRAVHGVTPEGMERLEVPAGTWAVFPFERVQFPRGLQALWLSVYTEWFPAHPTYRTAPGPALVAVEHEEEPDLGSGHLWLPVEKQAPVPE